jgi:hypothetical protein
MRMMTCILFFYLIGRKAQLRRTRANSQMQQPDSANEERTKLLYAERERLFGEIEQLRRKNQ